MVAGENHARLLAGQEHLLAEAPPDVARADANPMLGYAQESPGGQTDFVGMLAGDPNPEPIAEGIPARDQAARLHGQGGLAALVKGAGHDVGSAAEELGQLRLGRGVHLAGDVRSRLRVHQVLAVLGGSLEVDDRGSGS